MLSSRRLSGILKAKKLLVCPWNDYLNNDTNEFNRRIKTRKVCSCWMCGNPRRFFKDKTTIQEKKNLIDFQEHVNNISKGA